MAIYALSDLHLYKSIKEKPMDIFGAEWDNHMEKLYEGCKILSEDDVLLIPGDISWAMYLNETFEDFKFIEEIPGKKIISKGNHDYWWESHKKLKDYVENVGFKTIFFLHNNFFEYKGIALCGNKGYLYNPAGYRDNPTENAQHDKLLYERELARMELSLSSAEKAGLNLKVFQTHYPPSRDNVTPDEKVLELFEKYNVKACVYGHLHGASRRKNFEGTFGKTQFHFVSCEHIGFTPKLIME